jgi:hypothetical protein
MPAGGTEGGVHQSAALLLSSGFVLLWLCRESCQGGAFAERLQDRGHRGDGPGWWEPSVLASEPEVLVLAGSMDMGLAWCLTGCALWGHCGCHLGGVPLHVRVAER